jgi:drug/metabolite transporter (DMT)-like permease
MRSRPQSIAVLAALVALTFWGGTAIANRYAVGFADAVTVAALRSMLAGLLALGIAFALRLKWPADRSDQWLLLLSGLFSFAFWPILLSLGLERTTASHAALIMATLPIFTVLLASIVNRRAPPFAWWVGGAMALAGALILVADRNTVADLSGWQSVAAGDLIILLGCVLCAIGYVAGGKLSSKIGAFATTFWGLSIALLITIPVFIVYQSNTDWSALPVAAWWALAWLVLCSSLFGYVLWFFALGQGGIEKIGSLQLLMPVIALVGAVLILDEIFTLKLALLAGLVLAGTVIAHQFSNREE